MEHTKIDYVFTPSFENLSKLGEPHEIVNAYAVLLSNDAYNAITRFKEPNQYVINYINEKITLQLEVARKVLTCCCSNDVTHLIASKTKKGLIKIQNIIMIARCLLDYGVAGKVKVRVSQRNENKIIKTAVKQEIANDISSHQGDVWQAMSNSTNIQSKL
ncbi:DUF6246 family protein [Frischella japonica]